MNRKIYITSSACISGQNSFLRQDWQRNLNLPIDGILPCIEPDYKEWIDVKNIRRMNRVQRMGYVAALQCLRQANVDHPEAIIAGTGWGCIDSTYRFLERLYDLQHLPVNPSAFIQSTHNTVAAQIALMLQCNGYNNTITDNRLAFELALDDAILHMNESGAAKCLVGCFDEMIPELVDILKKVRSPLPIEVQGEGSAFFLLSRQPDSEYAAEIKHMQIASFRYIEENLNSIIETNLVRHITAEQKDVLETGSWKDFHGTKSAFGHLCGHFPTNSGFGLWFAMDFLQKNDSGNVLLYNKSRSGMSTVTIIGKPD